MKQKTVLYQDLFNPLATLKASNKLPNENQYIRMKLAGKKFINNEEKEFYLKKLAQETTCECHHPTTLARDGICSFRSCRHKISDHP